MTCTDLREDQILISRTAFIVSITICVFTTSTCLLAVAALLYREHHRRQQSSAARAWGRQSHVNARLSFLSKACKAIDDDYSIHYRGCLVSVPENPEMGSDSPVEMMDEDKVWEAPSVPAKVVSKDDRKGRAKSLFFDYGVGLWISKR